MMGLLSWIKGDDDNVVVKTGRSKGPGKPEVAITVGDIRNGRVSAVNGYQNEVVFFVRANKADRKAKA